MWIMTEMLCLWTAKVSCSMRRFDQMWRVGPHCLSSAERKLRAFSTVGPPLVTQSLVVDGCGLINPPNLTKIFPHSDVFWCEVSSYSRVFPRVSWSVVSQLRQLQIQIVKLVKPHFPSCSFIFPYFSSLDSWISFVQGWNSAPLGVLRWRSCRPMAAHNSASFVRQEEGRLGLGCGSPQWNVGELALLIHQTLFVYVCSIMFYWISLFGGYWSIE